MKGLIESFQKTSKNPMTTLLFGHLKNKHRNLRFGSAFVLASLISGINWYYQSAWAKNETQHQKDILNKVDSDSIREDFMHKFNYRKYEQWQGQKVALDGILYPARMIVKRKRGDQDGYMVFAPYVIQKYPGPQLYRRPFRAFVLNLGWVPKESKHLISQAALMNAIPPNDYSENLPEAYEKTEQKGDRLERVASDADNWYAVSSITAYVRKGEQEDIGRGYRNWQNDRLYKFIDLDLMSKLFGVTNNKEAETVYLERIQPEDDEGSIPIPTSKDLMMNEINKQISYIEKKRRDNVFWGASLSFLSAFVVSAL